MTIVTIGIAAGTMLVMAVIMSYILGWANVKFHVEVDPRVEAVNNALPGANCGGCGFIGCSDYAEAVVKDNAPVNKCPVGGAACAAEVAGIMGIEAGEALIFRPVVHCGATADEKKGRTDYFGEQKCAAATLVAGVQSCTFGCLGFGDCVAACKYDAIHVEKGLAVVDYEKCIGCGACVKACPRNIVTMSLFEEDRVPAVLCSNKDKGKDVTSVCDKGCIGCKACTRIDDMFVMDGDIAITVGDGYSAEKVENVDKAIEKCPNDCINYVGKTV
ncbi:RnfB [Desulfamplus magnetovallimortis]|uniref:Ion-translocating oxidoreductase complex subunit B n=1 Tax=Desulfamplus magnetovallimortis TaxID=1246637 RepID=A0A1W1HCH0_9BACT|nr:RnfABCDGE type electron transport complex subunit B [Desulfamplus magnetovallimortis]SLM30078.1 RnfB [Desulfamplus magnetovallimortis]